MDKKTKMLFFKGYLKGILETANKFTNLTFAELKRLDEKTLKQLLKEMEIPFYETNIRTLTKQEMDESGNIYNPIVNFIENSPEQKVLIVTIDHPLKKKELEMLADMKFYAEIDKFNIKPNTLVIINNAKNKKDIIKSAINKIRDEQKKEKLILIIHDILYI
jgi:hypothetical protein